MNMELMSRQNYGSPGVRAFLDTLQSCRNQMFYVGGIDFDC